MIFNQKKFRAARGERSIADVAFAMAQILGRPVSYYTIRNWELGRANPKEELFNAYRKVTKKPLMYFVDGGEPR